VLIQARGLQAISRGARRSALILSSVILFSSEDSHESIQPDPNTYQPFKAMNTLIMERQHETLTSLADTKGMLLINGKGFH